MKSTQPTKQDQPPTTLPFATPDRPTKVRGTHLCQKSQKRCPGLITGDLPVEIELEIYSYLSAKDITNISTTCGRGKTVVDKHAHHLAKPLVKYHQERLRQDAAFLNLEGLSFVTAWRRFSQIFEVNRQIYGDFEFSPVRSSLVFSYARANPGPGAPTPLQYFDIMETILGISDWCRWYKGGIPTQTWPAARLSGRWKRALLEAAGHDAQYKPGRYSGLVLAFRDEAPEIQDPCFIIQAFEEVRAEPLIDGSHLAGNMDQFTAIRAWAQAKLRTDVGVPASRHSPYFFFAHRNSPRAEELMHRINWEGELSGSLLYAALLDELGIKWSTS